MARKQNTRICTVEGCDRPYLANGYCSMHRQRVEKHGDINRGRLPPKICIVEGCEAKNDTKGMCGKHYQRFARYGNVDYVTSAEDFRMIVRMTRPNTGTAKPGTYKKFLGRHLHRRVAEEKLGRPLLPGETVHHLDGNKHNNDPANIEVLESQSVHAKRHRGYGGRFRSCSH